MAVRGKDKRIKYHNAFNDPFTPIIIGTGGYPSLKAKTWLQRLTASGSGKDALIFDLSAAVACARATAVA